MRKLYDYKNCGLDINKTVKSCELFEYFSVTIIWDGTSNENINKRINQGKRGMGQVNSVLWNNKITKKNLGIIESIVTYGSETWEVSI